MAGMVRETAVRAWLVRELISDIVDRTTEEAQGGKAVGVDPSLITACECSYIGCGSV